MPQLRDSSNSGPTSRTVSVTPDTSFERIFGIETEYGLSVTGEKSSTEGAAKLDAARVASVMFEPVVAQSRSTNTYADNGSRLYLDVGAHPEYATAETRTVSDAVLLDAAGENLMAALAHGAERALQEREGEPDLRVHMYKNNADSQGHSFGCHENYLVRRSVSLRELEKCFIPFLVTRQIFAGAGTFRDGEYQISQRADFLDDTISSATTRSRPMINTRDEPHADSRLYRRLHVIVGDSNRSQRATWMKMMTAHLVLCMLEAQSRGEDYRLGVFAMNEPGFHMKKISRDLDFRYRIPLAGGVEVSAIQIQREYCDAAELFLQRHADELKPDMRDDAAVCVQLWRRTLEQCEARDWTALASWVDWVAKYQLISGAVRRGASEAKGLQLDFAYHDIAHDTVLSALQSRGFVQALYSMDAVRRARHEAPRGTRAELRGEFLRLARQSPARWSADWTSLSAAPAQETRAVTAHILDPFSVERTAEYEAVCAVLRGGRGEDPMLPLI
ncbi:hypothetical protein B9G54_02920 [Alloscardovia macacae]|uniref:Pup--protein ligase n=1 Tax=Alloscardovia macacae TaxID=1160091 RepID=A0A1Y2SZW2_9BIFI|nr:proteasome accessory factor PafA2 family protein [Alloscardovia macacae]OTA26997.1 hypothetical protein B9G54_02920 [Alloscardovia macacae]OTA30016.1 hypothetical protein B9T39_01230 [Alloscardovia macacae]